MVYRRQFIYKKIPWLSFLPIDSTVQTAKKKLLQQLSLILLLSRSHSEHTLSLCLWLFDMSNFQLGRKKKQLCYLRISVSVSVLFYAIAETKQNAELQLCECVCVCVESVCVCVCMSETANALRNLARLLLLRLCDLTTRGRGRQLKF